MRSRKTIQIPYGPNTTTYIIGNLISPREEAN